MPSFSYKIPSHGNLLSRPIAPVGITKADDLPSIQEIENKLKTGQEVDTGKERNFSIVKGLLDTGATGSCITQSLARKIGVKPLIQKRRVHTASGEEMRSVYRVIIQMLWESDRIIDDKNTGNKKIERIISPASGLSVIDASEFTNKGEGDVDVIIGMDIIGESTMIVLGHEKLVILAF